MSLFYYVTYKLVLLKDKRLGVLYYVLAVLALLYTVVEIFIRKGYMDFDTSPHGTVKLILSDEFSNESFRAQDLPYCRGKTPCQYLDPWDLNWPSESRAVTIATYAKDRVQERVSTGDGSRVDFNNTKESVYFTQGPEYVVIKLDHAVVASKFMDSEGRQSLAASHRQLVGHLMDPNGRVIREFSSDASEKGKADRVTLQELLLAAGVQSLDEPSDILDARGRSFRQRGCILRVTIFYQNWMSVWVGASAMDYRYHVQRIPFMDYNSKQVDPLLSKEEVLREGGVHQARWRLQRKRYSVRVEFQLAGSLAMFSLPTLILKLVSGVALLTLIATITDTLALYLLPNKGTYRKMVYEESPDFKAGSQKHKSLDPKQESHDQKQGSHDHERGSHDQEHGSHDQKEVHYHKQKPEKQD